MCPESKPIFLHPDHMKLPGFILTVMLSAALVAQAQPSKKSLNGEWSFALDPVKVGEQQEWYKAPPFPGWDRVTVPHSFSVDKRYERYTGTAWYIREIGPVSKAAGYRTFLRFEAVFYKCSVWLNGKFVGAHEGGYTPFELDLTDALGGQNILAVEVNNAWDTTTIPGAKTQIGNAISNTGQVFPWINYGGITREVFLITRPDVYIEKVKIDADPDLKKNTAALRLTLGVRNLSGMDVTPSVEATVYQDGTPIQVKFKSTRDPGVAGRTTLTLEGTVPKKNVHLWNQDDPYLYDCRIVLGKDTVKTRFGIRKIAVQGTRLLLNGEPIRMGGCNRPLDYPGFGSMDPPQVIEQDFNLIKSASMELSRMNHYPMSPHILEWADAHGLLIIGEAGNWQMTPQQMADSAMRLKFESQMREMIERDWNHPSIIAWSTGNEYMSYTPEGLSWTRDMKAFANHLDPSRLVTFASMYVWRDFIKKGADEASQYVDFVSTNIYGNHLANLTKIHNLYPDKPVFISEFGARADQVKTEEDRVQHLKKAMADFRQCDYLFGASLWTFNDYQSMFPGTNANGYRPWGLVTPEREKREMYYAVQEEFAPATIEASGFEDGKVNIKISARTDFPSYTLRGYTLRCGQQSVQINTLKPGESQTVTFTATADEVEISLVKPGDFVILTKTIKR